jgi:large subunit ribosomal protein LP2
MRHIAAYLLLQIGGNASPSADDVKKVLSAVGIEADDDRLEKLISELEDKDINAVRFFSRLYLTAPVFDVFFRS